MTAPVSKHAPKLRLVEVMFYGGDNGQWVAALIAALIAGVYSAGMQRIPVGACVPSQCTFEKRRGCPLGTMI